jgi:hypothetical protein
LQVDLIKQGKIGVFEGDLSELEKRHGEKRKLKVKGGKVGKAEGRDLNLKPEQEPKGGEIIAWLGKIARKEIREVARD